MYKKIIGWALAAMFLPLFADAAANIKFVLHGDSMSAYLHSGAGKTGQSYTPLNYSPAATTEADATAIGGSRLTFDTGQSDVRGWVWPGFSNGSTTGKFSILARIKFPMTPPPANPTMLFAVSGFTAFTGSQTSSVALSLNADGTLRIHLWNNRNAQIFANSSFGSWSPSAGVWYDVVLTWDGTTGANKVIVYIDGTSFGTKTATAAAADANGNYTQAAILLGAPTVSGFRGDILVNEFVLWDDVIDPTSGGLNLNGASRSSFVSTSGLTLDPNSSTDPGVANVRSGTGYSISGVSKTGTAAIPTAANVRSGTAVDATTGTLAVPSAANVRFGTAVDNTTGTCRVPSAADVRSGTNVDATTGTLAVPSAANVRSGTSVDNTTGTLTVPSLANTKIGVAGDGGTGTYDGSDRWTCPTAGQISSGVSIKCNSTSTNRTGTLQTVTNVLQNATTVGSSLSATLTAE